MIESRSTVLKKVSTKLKHVILPQVPTHQQSVLHCTGRCTLRNAHKIFSTPQHLHNARGVQPMNCLPTAAAPTTATPYKLPKAQTLVMEVAGKQVIINLFCLFARRILLVQHRGPRNPAQVRLKTWVIDDTDHTGNWRDWASGQCSCHGHHGRNCEWQSRAPHPYCV